MYLSKYSARFSHFIVKRSTPARRFVGIKSLLLLLPVALCQLAHALSPPDIAFFEKHIRPALAQHCYECHAAGAKEIKADLRLDYRGGWERGGKSGPAIVPGKPQESRLLKAIHYQDPDLEMPPKGALSKELIAHFEEWIRRGAPDPRDKAGPRLASRQIDMEAGRQFWSFKPRSNPPLPVVANKRWPLQPIDHFILSSLEKRNLTPSEDTSPHLLLRRLHLDLTGLPPTLAEIERFILQFRRDPNAAIESKVDQLLADPGFGERWGRHWLDLARYSDSTGGGRAIPLPDAWRFRDYVIEAFKQDRPLDQLIREHLAGDLLATNDPKQRRRNLTATGFLLLGPHNYENQDKDLLELEIIDEQLDTLGRSFLGMTIGCARCHDHKFDPIPASDYYAMAGIFKSTVFVKHSNVSSWNKENLPLSKKEQAQKKTLDADIKSLEAEQKRLRSRLSKIKPKPNERAKFVDVKTLPGIVMDNRKAVLKGEWLRSQSNPHWVGEEYIHDKSEKGTEKSATYKLKIPQSGSYEVRISYSAGSNRPQKALLRIEHADGRKEVRIDQRDTPPHDGLFMTVGTFPFDKEKGAMVQISNKGTSGALIADAVQLLPRGFELPNQPELEKPKKKPALSAETKAEIAKLETTIKEQEADLKKLKSQLPKATTLMAVRDGKPTDSPIHLGGLPRRLGDEVKRGALRVAQRDNSSLAISSGSGRLELANWITSAENPLTARVLANRIWLHLMGHGLVRTPDNFGQTGTPPSHPELLDHLAQQLIDHKWSTKKLVRDIVRSRTYRLSSTPRAGTRDKDPDNHFLSHAHRRPIDAEALRDSILHLAGNLERDGGGPALPSNFKTEFGFKFDSKHRSVYVPVFRNRLHEVFAQFDFANPNFTVGYRTPSNIPTQALFLANSPFMHRHSKDAAQKLLALPAESPAHRIEQAFLRTLSRPPNAEELSLAEDFVSQNGDNPEDWTGLQRTLFQTIDFRFLR